MLHWFRIHLVELMAEMPSATPSPPAAPGLGRRILGMFNVFVDPHATACLIPYRWSWAPPLAFSSAVIAFTSWLNIPIALDVMRRNPPGNMSAEQLARALPMISLTQKIAALAGPVIMMAILAIFAALLSAASVLLNIRSRFRDNFSLLAHAGLIGILQQLAGFIVIRLRAGEIQTIQELRPSFGLDLLLGEGSSGLLRAVLSYFSIFTVWYIVMLGLTFASLTGISKGKAFGATAPVWILSMVLAVAGMFFSRF